MPGIDLYAAYGLDRRHQSPELAQQLTARLDQLGQWDTAARQRIEIARAILGDPARRASYDVLAANPTIQVTEQALAAMAGISLQDPAPVPPPTPPSPNQPPIKITGTEEFAGRTVVEHLGPIDGHGIVIQSILKEVKATFTQLRRRQTDVNTALLPYREACARSRAFAIEELTEHALELGADAIISFSINFTTENLDLALGFSLTSITTDVTGIAVRLGPPSATD
ncbi:MAG: heavy metal-binding domain-containing protein [Gordonia sp. (in: high G+C Gram-positive bacteria)]|uniref:heavy metal-binding domain-containing protein n=1 Tax=Gordonia sp. (in: high G+C Gram-positive bacteria) TaxID=84139 RepID=UPI0039E2E99B